MNSLSAKIEKLYSDQTKIISVIVPSGSESVFDTDDEDDEESTSNHRGNDTTDIKS